MAISLNMLTTSVMRQGGSEGVQPQPSRGSTPDCLIGQCDQSFANPWRDDGFVSRLRLQSVRGPESEIHGFCHSVFRRECLTSLSRVASFAERITPGSVMSQVPPPCSAIKFVRGGAECGVGCCRPVGGVVAGVWCGVGGGGGLVVVRFPLPPEEMLRPRMVFG